MEIIDKLDTLAEGFRDSIIEELGKLIKIKSVREQSTPNAPFGPGISQCLHNTLDLCSRLGFRVKNLDNYAGYAEFGDGPETEGILVHLDVVPAGSGWDTDPFGAEIKNGYMYGRGTQDDKGPVAAVIYAAKAVLDSGLPLKKKVRIIFGCDEENLWECMDHYKKQEPLPDCGFSPDAQYPVIHAERGVLFIDVHGVCNERGGPVNVKEISGGEKANMVPDRCTALLETKERENVSRLARQHQLKESWNGNTVTLEALGKNAHASTPEKGKNSISMMMGMLGELSGITGSQRDFIRFFNSRIGFNLTGSNLCGDIRDEVSGPMVFNAGVLEWKGSNIHLKLNIRYPVTIKGEEIIRRLDDSVKNCGYTTKLVLDSAPLYVSCDDPLVTALMDIYHHYRDDKTKPLLIGGGTFARSIPHAVAFGPMFPEEEDLAHCANENISLDNLVLNAKIYAQAIYALAK